jgi:hypothetical protein
MPMSSRAGGWVGRAGPAGSGALPELPSGGPGHVRGQLPAQKRAPESAVSLSALPEMSGALSAPDEAFEAAWAREVLRESLSRMREECRRLFRGVPHKNLDERWEGRAIALVLREPRAGNL